MLHLVDDGDDFGAVDDFGLESAAIERHDCGGDGVFDEARVHVGEEGCEMEMRVGGGGWRCSWCLFATFGTGTRQT